VRLDPVGIGSTCRDSHPASILATFLNFSADMLEELLRFCAAARRSNGDSSMRIQIKNRVIED
jgi:hypothetical protein